MKYAHLSDLLRKDSINTQNQLVALSDYIWKDCLYAGRSTGSYMIFYQGGKIDHGTHVPEPVAKQSTESE